MTNVSDLSVVDIEFLQAARDINKNPENYEKTGNSAYPANTASIKRATDLTDEQVSYRMGGNSNSKGFEKGDKNLIISHDPQVQGSTLGPRSIELTSHGYNILDKAEKRMSRFAGVSKKEFEEVKRTVQNQNELLTEIFDFDPSEMAVDDKTIAHCGSYILARLHNLSDEWERIEEQEQQ